MNKKEIKNLSLISIIFIILLIFFDQLTKYLIVRYVKINSAYLSFFGDFFRIIHVRNTGILFSIGSDVSLKTRNWFFILIPAFILVFILLFSLKEKKLYKKVCTFINILWGSRKHY